uniref:DIS3-like exonuclease 2 n=1 Tax=Phallusia mammillata TaxID=59560 RepID=A0A6F9DBK2_9ASCI|nr:DIS3-like exonuclease 2 [Phallusia mammillata]
MIRRFSILTTQKTMSSKTPSAKSKNVPQRNHRNKSSSSNSPSNNSTKNSLNIWPSDEHRVVTFFCKNKNAINLDQHIAPFGTVKQVRFLTRKNVVLNRIEMSTSAEAKSLWERYRTNLLDGVLEVKADTYHTLSPNNNKESPRKVYEEHWSAEDIAKGVESGDVLTGRLRINPKMFKYAFVSNKVGKDIVIVDLEGRNRALAGDVVAVKLVDQSQNLDSPEPVSELCNEVESLNVAPNNDSGSSENANSPPGSFKQPRSFGKVVGILESNHSRLASGKIEIPKRGNPLFKPVTSGFPYVSLNQKDIDEKISKYDISKVLFTAKIKSWESDHIFPKGELVDCIGEAGEVATETTSILIDHDVDFQDFSPSVTDCLPKDLPWMIPQEERSKRRDFTKECIFSIDPSTARDLDDALHCRKLESGHFEVGVHIADVSYFVKPKTELDKVASSRCTTVYMVEKAIPMLPSMLCEDLCSLNPGVQRLAFSVVWTIDKKGKIYSQWFGRSIIRSCVKFSYDHAQSFIDNPDLDLDKPGDVEGDDVRYPPITGGFSLNLIKSKVLQLHEIAQNLRRQRIDSGALKLDQVRLAYTLDAESGMPNGCYKYVYKQSNELIEEFMLLANISVAHKIYKHLKEQAFLRCHPEPKQNMMEDVVSHCNEIGFQIDASSSQSLARSLNIAAGEDELADCRKQALFMLAIKPQQLAQYFCAGAVEDEELYRHYALNVPLYTHFTSPIRRYADVIVHRQLAYVLGDKSESNLMETDASVLHKQAQLCNDKKMNSKSAQEQSINLFFTLMVNNFGPLECRGMVMYVYDHSFDVISIEYGVVKRVYLEELPLLSFKTDETKRTGKDLQVNVLKLKWPTGDLEGRNKVGKQPPNYEQCGEGVEQTIDVFDIVDLVLFKSSPHSVRKFSVSIKRPDENAVTEQSTTARNSMF